MVYIAKKNAALLVGAAALVSSVNGAAIPGGQHGAAILDIEASVLRLPDALPQRTFALPETAGAKRSWRGRKGKRGPWRTDHATELINLDLGNGPHDHQGSLLNIETAPHRYNARHHHDDDDDVIVVDSGRHGHHGHDVVEIHDHDNDHTHEHVHEHIHDRRRHDDTVMVDGGYRGYYDDYRHHGHGHRHGHYHGHDHEHGRYGDVIYTKRRHNDDVVVIDGGRHRHHDVEVIHTHGDGHDHDHDHDHVHSHVHSHGDNVVINEKRRSSDTVVVAGHRHGTTVVSGGRHGTTVIDNGRHRHNDKVVVVDGDRHRKGVTVVSRDTKHRHGSDTQIGMDGHGSEMSMKGEKEPTVRVDKRHSGNVVVVDGHRNGYYDSGRYYDYPAVGRPMYFGRGHGYSGMRGVYVDGGHRHAGWYKRSHSDDRHGRDRNDRHGDGDRHGGRHCHRGKCNDHAGETTVVTKRDDNSVEMGGAPGYIDVTSGVFNSTTAQRIASLVLSTTNGTESNSSFVLNASNNIRTQVYLVPTNSSSASAESQTDGPLKVNLKLPIFVAQSASVEPYCATFDPAPTNPGPLFVTKCLADGQDQHSSQVFLYDPSSGIIHPDWDPTPAAQAVLAAVPDSVEDNADVNGEGEMASASAADDQDMAALAASASASSAPSGSASASASASASSTAASASSTSSAPPAINTTGPKASTDSTTLDSKASNVTLVFTPVNPTVNQANVMAESNDSDAQAPMSASSTTDMPSDAEMPDMPEDQDVDAGNTVGARAYGYPYDQDYPRGSAGGYYAPSPYDAEDDYPQYESEPVPAWDEYSRGGNEWTAPYDWRWTKSADTTTAPSAAATFA